MDSTKASCQLNLARFDETRCN